MKSDAGTVEFPRCCVKSLSGVPKLFCEYIHPDVVLLQVSPKDRVGYFSLGTTSAYRMTAARTCNRLIVEVDVHLRGRVTVCVQGAGYRRACLGPPEVFGAPSGRGRSAKPYRFKRLPRLVAGLPVLFFGVRHVLDPDPFHAILIASGLPMVEFNVIAAPLAECVAAALLLSGFLARLGGALGVVTMLPAIYATLTLKGLDPAHLPAGLTQVPFVPPLSLPVVVLLSALAALILGAGAWSVDAAMGTNGMATMRSAPLRSR